MSDDQRMDAAPMDEEAWRKFVCDRFRDGSQRMDCMQTDIAANKDATAEILEIFKAVKGGFRVLGWIGSGVKWVGGIAAAGTAMVAAYQFVVKLFSK